MAPPSGASIAAKGPAKKPIVPAIPYNLPVVRASAAGASDNSTPQQGRQLAAPSARHKDPPGPQPQQARKETQGQQGQQPGETIRQPARPQQQQGQQPQPEPQPSTKQRQTPALSPKQPGQPVRKDVTAAPAKQSQVENKQQQAPRSYQAVAASAQPATSPTASSRSQRALAHAAPAISTNNTPSNSEHVGNLNAPATAGGPSTAASVTGKPTPNGAGVSSKRNSRRNHKANASTSRAHNGGNRPQSAGHEGKGRKTTQSQHPKNTNPKHQPSKASVSSIENAPKQNSIGRTSPSPSSSGQPLSSVGHSSSSSPPSTASGTASLPEDQALSSTPPTPKPAAASGDTLVESIMGSTAVASNGIPRDPAVAPHVQTSGDFPVSTVDPSLHGPGVKNLIFGGADHSGASSPAPPLSGGSIPPPPAIFPGAAPAPAFGSINGAAHNRMPSGIGYSIPPPMHLSVAPDHIPATTGDIYGRPFAFAPHDGFPPMNGPGTPHSFPGSGSPLFADRDNAAAMDPGAQQHRGASPNQLLPPPGPFPPMLNSHMQAGIDDCDQLLEYIRRMFNDASTSDCTIEFRPVDKREAPIHVHGHRAILSRSNTLGEKLRQAASEQPAGKIHLVIETPDRNVTPLAFYMALGRLYGHPLLQNPHPASDMDMAGSGTERLEHALAYVAAGSLIGVPPVVCQGFKLAVPYVSWATVERCLSFALDHAPYPDNFPSADGEVRLGYQFAYSNPTAILVDGIMDFLIHNWPRNFSLDTLDVKLAGYDRLPRLEPAHKAPTIAHGTHTSRQADKRSLSNIQFGDVDNSEFGGTGSISRSREMRILSRILLNMPFLLLKFLMESMAHHSREEREKAFVEVVTEREERRSRAMRKIYGGGCQGSAQLRSWLDQGTSLEFGDPSWVVLGWKEFVSYHPETGLPCLSRRWFAEPRSPAGG